MTATAPNLLDRISADRDRLSRAFRQTADMICSQPETFLHSPIRALSQAIGVSEPTLIRFSRSYGYRGLPEMKLALAMALASANSGVADRFEPPLTARETLNLPAKAAIARLAATLLAEDQSVILDSGSTVRMMADHMRDLAPLRVMTTGLNVMAALMDRSPHEVMLPGGTVRAKRMSVGGRLAERCFADLSFDTIYLGADSIAPGFGLSTFREDEAHLNRAMLMACRRVVVLADHTKFRAPSLHRICDLSEVDIIVTDGGLPDETRRALMAEGPRLMLAEVNHNPPRNGEKDGD